MKFWPLLMVLAAPAAMADWQLVADQSSLSFVSVKNVDIAEAHRFTELSGSIGADGSFQLMVKADSVDTRIPIRDERLREQLLNSGEFPFARASGRIDWGAFADLRVGETTRVELQAELEFLGRSSPLAIQVQVSCVAENALQVVSLAPILLSARTLGVADGVEALRAIAGLQSISMAVPVYFSLRFERAP